MFSVYDLIFYHVFEWSRCVQAETRIYNAKEAKIGTTMLPQMQAWTQKKKDLPGPGILFTKVPKNNCGGWTKTASYKEKSNEKISDIHIGNYKVSVKKWFQDSLKHAALRKTGGLCGHQTSDHLSIILKNHPKRMKARMLMRMIK